jgi:hypothetical protein
MASLTRPQAASIRCSRVTTRPQFFARTSMIASSRAVMGTDLLAAGTATAEGTDAGEELRDGEWLRQVVVGSRIETRNTITNRSPSGEEQDRRGHLSLAERPAQVDPRAIREHHVENQQIEPIVHRTRMRLGAAPGRD